jgi:hypothetical protein
MPYMTFQNSEGVVFIDRKSVFKVYFWTKKHNLRNDI